MALIGSQGQLASSIINRYQDYYDIQAFGKDTYDIRDKTVVNNLAQQIVNADVIINCAGIFGQDAWDQLLVNTVAPMYLLSKLTELKCQSKFIQIGSHSAMWTSWPGIDINRLIYSVSKNCIQSAITGLSHSGTTKMSLTIINPSKFKSKMSNWDGYDVDVVIEYINFVINNANPPILLEMEAISARHTNNTT